MSGICKSGVQKETEWAGPGAGGAPARAHEVPVRVTKMFRSWIAGWRVCGYSTHCSVHCPRVTSTQRESHLGRV